MASLVQIHHDESFTELNLKILLNEWNLTCKIFLTQFTKPVLELDTFLVQFELENVFEQNLNFFPYEMNLTEVKNFPE